MRAPGIRYRGPVCSGSQGVPLCSARASSHSPRGQPVTGSSGWTSHLGSPSPPGALTPPWPLKHAPECHGHALGQLGTAPAPPGAPSTRGLQSSSFDTRAKAPQGFRQLIRVLGLGFQHGCQQLVLLVVSHGTGSSFARLAEHRLCPGSAWHLRGTGAVIPWLQQTAVALTPQGGCWCPAACTTCALLLMPCCVQHLLLPLLSLNLVALMSWLWAHSL